MNKFNIDLIVDGSIDDIVKALREVADAIEDAKGEHEVAILDGVDDETWKIENSSFSIQHNP
jgi:hypothetical protein